MYRIVELVVLVMMLCRMSGPFYSEAVSKVFVISRDSNGRDIVIGSIQPGAMRGGRGGVQPINQKNKCWLSNTPLGQRPCEF